MIRLENIHLKLVYAIPNVSLVELYAFASAYLKEKGVLIVKFRMNENKKSS